MSASTAHDAVVVPNVFRSASNSDAVAATVAIPASPQTAKAPSWTRWSKSRLLLTLRLGNCCNGMCLVVLGIVIFLLPTGSLTPSFESITLSSYVIFLGLLMCIVELNLGLLQAKLRRNCGFMFSFIGRTLFLVFCATMALALQTWLAYIVGGLTGGNALFNCLVIATHPAFRSGELTATGDPWRGARTAEEHATAYARAHPEIVVAAAAAAASAAVGSGARGGFGSPAAAASPAPSPPPARWDGRRSHAASDASAAAPPALLPPTTHPPGANPFVTALGGGPGSPGAQHSLTEPTEVRHVHVAAAQARARLNVVRAAPPPAPAPTRPSPAPSAAPAPHRAIAIREVAAEDDDVPNPFL